MSQVLMTQFLQSFFTKEAVLRPDHVRIPLDFFGSGRPTGGDCQVVLAGSGTVGATHSMFLLPSVWLLSLLQKGNTLLHLAAISDSPKTIAVVIHRASALFRSNDQRLSLFKARNHVSHPAAGLSSDRRASPGWLVGWLLTYVVDLKSNGPTPDNT